MYSPKISDDLVPALYWLAKERRIPMTRLVDSMIRKALASNGSPELTQGNPSRVPGVPEIQPRNAA
jgi:hypothetical protein